MISALLTSLLALASAAPTSQSFGIVTIHSGSQYQYSSLKIAEDGHLTIDGDSNTDTKFILSDAGQLTANGQNVSITNNQPLIGQWSSDHFSIEGSSLAWLGSTAFYICDNKQVYYGRFGVPDGCANPVGVALRTV